jgi:hypothetical protein
MPDVAALLPLPAVGDNAAMQTESPKADPPKRKRRWFQFSLRSLLIAVAVTALLCAIVSRLPKPNELTLKQLQSIKAGMTEDKVLELVGRPNSIRPNEKGGVDWFYGILFPDWIELKDGRVVSAIRF